MRGGTGVARTVRTGNNGRGWCRRLLGISHSAQLRLHPLPCFRTFEEPGRRFDSPGASSVFLPDHPDKNSAIVASTLTSLLAEKLGKCTQGRGIWGLVLVVQKPFVVGNVDYEDLRGRADFHRQGKRCPKDRRFYWIGRIALLFEGQEGFRTAGFVDDRSTLLSLERRVLGFEIDDNLLLLNLLDYRFGERDREGTTKVSKRLKRGKIAWPGGLCPCPYCPLEPL